MNATGSSMRRIALVGRTNAGKTSLLMQLTGSLQRPVNFPGSSVECVESDVRHGGVDLRIVDLPGVSGLVANSRDEGVALAALEGRDDVPPDMLCVVVDAGKLVVDLRLLDQLRRLRRPMVVALAKVDVAAAEGFPIDVERLRQALGLPLFVVNGATGAGVAELRAAMATLPLQAPSAASGASFGGEPTPTTRARSRTDRIDAVLLHPVFGFLFLLLVGVGVFQLVFTVATPAMEWIEAGQERVAAGVRGVVEAGALQSFLVDGVVNGLGSALVFVPQIALLLAFVTIVEATGYMARAVFLLDVLLRKVGLNGRSFVPLTSSFACAIPGIVASRILADERDRLATIAVVPLMSCSARLPVYVVLLGSFFPPHQAGFVLFGLYTFGVVVAAVVAKLLRKTALRGGLSALVMELPVYQRPRWRLVGAHTWLAVRGFLRTAGSVILVATMVVWALGYFPHPQSIAATFAAERATLPTDASGDAERERLAAREAAAYLEQSYLARAGRAIQPVFAPAGFDWRLTVGVLAAFPARELVVPTLGTLYSLGDVAVGDEADVRLRDALREAKDADGRPTMDGLVALAVMVFFALCSQCAGTLAAIRRETNSWRWPLFTFTYMTVLAWLAAVLVYQVGRWLGFGR